MRLSLVLALALLVPRLAAAQSTAPRAAEPFRLKWSAPAECPSEQAVSDETRRLLSESKRAPGAKLVEVQAQVSRSSRGFSLELRLGSSATAAPRVRSLEAPTCHELAGAAALVVALAIDPLLQPPATPEVTSAVGVASTGKGPEQMGSSPCPEPPASLECPVPPAPVAPPPAPLQIAPESKCPACAAGETHAGRDEHYSLLAGSGVAFGALPQALPRVSLGGAYRSGVHRIELSVNMAFASAGPRPEGDGASFVLAFAAPRYCARMRVGSGTAGVCGLMEIGASSATGFGVDEPNTRWSPWFSSGAGIEAGVPLAGGGELLLAGDLSVVATRTRFELDGTSLFSTNLLVPAIRLMLATGI